MSCNRCEAKNAPFGYKYPLLPGNTVVSLCFMCYKLLNNTEPDIKKQAALVVKYEKTENENNNTNV